MAYVSGVRAGESAPAAADDIGKGSGGLLQDLQKRIHRQYLVSA